MTKKALIIPAAGSGSRMQKETPKPYLSLCGKPILEHTLGRFLSLPGLKQIIIATSQEYLGTAEEILQGLVPDSIAVDCLVGGEERQHSIYNGLARVDEVDLVLIHDAVRPFVKTEQIADCCNAASEYGGAVLGVPAKDTIKRIDEHRFIQDTPSRKALWQAQTPQVFRKKVIMDAYQQAFQDDFIGTDDSSLVERIGGRVKMVQGDRSNFKITYPLDFELAKTLIEKENLL